MATFETFVNIFHLFELVCSLPFQRFVELILDQGLVHSVGNHLGGIETRFNTRVLLPSTSVDRHGILTNVRLQMANHI